MKWQWHPLEFFAMARGMLGEALELHTYEPSCRWAITEAGTTLTALPEAPVEPPAGIPGRLPQGI